MISKIERGYITAEFRVNKDTRTLEGHAAVFNQLSVDLGGYREKILPGAFASTIQEDDIRALFNHDPNLVLGRTTAGTLKLSEDNAGLFYELSLPDTQVARDLVANIELGNVSQNSFGFRVLPEGSKWSEDQEGNLIRTLTNVKLYDISPVTYPAYPQTDLSIRSHEEILQDRPAVEKPVFSGIDLRRRKLELSSK